MLVSSTDSVGTKVKVAAAMGRYDTIGADIVNHCINDVFVAGAQPLFFLDYLATSKLDPAKIETIVSGMAAACREAGCALIGGETAELPDTYQEGDDEVVGFMVGAVEEANIIDGSKIRDGDLLLGLPSSGLHTNGYSLARKIFDIGRPGGANSQLDRHVAELHMTLGEALLTVHRSYYPNLRPHLDRIAGMAHVTGGGIIANTRRIVPEGLEATVDFEAWANAGYLQAHTRARVCFRRRDAKDVQHGYRHGGRRLAGQRGRIADSTARGDPHRIRDDNRLIDAAVKRLG